MDIARILNQLKQEQARLAAAISALEALDGAVTPKQAQPTGATFEFGANKTTRRGRRRMSPAARRRMSAMMKARWAERKAGKSGTKRQAAPKQVRRMSPAARKRIAEAKKQWWAQRRGTAVKSATPVKVAKSVAKSGGRRRISAEGRRRMAEATKKRWAEYRKNTA
jgi:hypothetical protein